MPRPVAKEHENAAIHETRVREARMATVRDACLALLAFIDDVKECAQCDTRNMSKVVYCAAHRAALNNLDTADYDD